MRRQAFVFQPQLLLQPARTNRHRVRQQICRAPLLGYIGLRKIRTADFRFTSTKMVCNEALQPVWMTVVFLSK